MKFQNLKSSEMDKEMNDEILMNPIELVGKLISKAKDNGKCFIVKTTVKLENGKVYSKPSFFVNKKSKRKLLRKGKWNV